MSAYLTQRLRCYARNADDRDAVAMATDLREAADVIDELDENQRLKREVRRLKDERRQHRTQISELSRVNYVLRAQRGE